MSLVPVFYDMETFWSQTYSLTKLTPIEYVMGVEYETQSVALKVGLDGPTEVIFGHEAIAERFARIDWSRAWAIAHNNEGFDSLILAWKFGIKPKLWGCTLAMSRPLHALDVGGSLKALAAHYGLQAKGSLEAVNTKGKRLADFNLADVAAMKEYNAIDAELCAELFKRLVKQTTTEELRLIDMTIRMIVEPKFEVDTELLGDALYEERKRKLEALIALSNTLRCDRTHLSRKLGSALKFASLLTDLGVPVPMKTSPKTGKEIPALAKTDEGMQELLDHDDPVVAMAAAVRLDTKSTILETRLQRFIDASRLCGGKMPMPLRYYGASTGRWAATFKMNVQNLPRVDPDKPKLSDALRKSLLAPRGYKVVVADLSGIELRVNHFLWKVQSSMDAFKADPKADLYRLYAAIRLHKDPEDVTKDERRLAKVEQLGLGYGAGWKTFQKVARTMGGLVLSDQTAKKSVWDWRDTYQPIVRGWKHCEKALHRVYNREIAPVDPWGLCMTDNGGIHIPKGVIRYPNMRRETVTSELSYATQDKWYYGEGRNKTFIAGFKVDENLVQAISRRVMTDVILAFARTELGHKYTLAHTVHDEVVYVVEDRDADDVLGLLLELMSTPPSWWPELITTAEGDIAQNYGDAK